MSKELTMLSIRFWHPTMPASSILENIQLNPSCAYDIGTPLSSKSENSMIHKETYVAFEFYKEQNSDPIAAIRKSNLFLRKYIEFVDIFVSSGGRIDYYLTIVCKIAHAFEMAPDIIKTCGRLHVSIGFEFFADLPVTGEN